MNNFEKLRGVLTFYSFPLNDEKTCQEAIEKVLQENSIKYKREYDLRLTVAEQFVDEFKERSSQKVISYEI